MNSAEAGLGGMIEQSLFKEISNLHLNQSGRSPVFSNPGKVLPNAVEPSILGNLPTTTPLSLVCGAFLESNLHTCLLLLIGHFGGLKVHLSNGRKEGWVFLTPPMKYLLSVLLNFADVS